jgi:hypothetical protein
METIELTEKIKIDHAEAWINLMPPIPTPGGTLHVFVEIVSNNHGRHFLQKRVSQGINPQILMLDIKLSPLDIFIFNPQRLSYSEGLSNQKQYTSIEIYSDGKKLITVNDIPVVQ